jgi:xeroderma pigmentosum group C-complementing protein
MLITSPVQPPRNGDPPMGKADFIAASEHRTGSRDLGAQLFCALLRSVGVTCRLVCSLQPLSFSFRGRGIPPKMPPGSPARQTSVAGSSDNSAVLANNRFGGSGLALQGHSKGSILRRPGSRDSVSKEYKRRNVTLDGPNEPAESKYPIFWVEAWSAPRQKWIAVDPLVTRTVGKPSVIEPPMSDQGNLMSYVVAFDRGQFFLFSIYPRMYVAEVDIRVHRRPLQRRDEEICKDLQWQDSETQSHAYQSRRIVVGSRNQHVL